MERTRGNDDGGRVRSGWVESEEYGFWVKERYIGGWCYWWAKSSILVLNWYIIIVSEYSSHVLLNK